MPTLALSELSLSQFRSHPRLRLSIAPRSVALFGPNGAGKTNVLEAISLFSPGRGLRRAQGGELALKPGAYGWKAKAELQARARIHELETGAEPSATRSVRIDGKAAPQTALARLVRILWLVPSMDRLWIEAAEGRRRFLDRTTMSLIPEHADAALAYEKSMRERNRLLKDDVTDPAWYAAVEAQMARQGAILIANRQAALSRIADAQSDVVSAFPVADLYLTHPDEDLPETEEALLTAFSDMRGRDLRAGRTLVGPHRTDLQATYRAKALGAHLCSTGEQKALLISIVLANARALATETGLPPILLLDEVAAHLDANRRAALYNEIDALDAQAWMTGTEPGLFDTLGDRASYLLVSETDGRSSVEEVNP